MLNGRLELHGVDAEKLARKALDDTLRSRGAHLSRDEHEDALSYVVSELWRISLEYDPERTASFATYGYRRGRLFALEWFRVRFGRTKWQFGDGRVYERPKREHVSLDADGPGGRRLDETVAAGSGDLADDRDPDLDGLVTGGSRQRARDLDELGIAPPRGIAA